MIPHCGTCKTWESVRPATFGNCPVQVARKTRSVFRYVVVLMNWQDVCDSWKKREEEK